MTARRFSLLVLALVLAVPAIAKDKKKAILPGYILQARTVAVVIDPDAGEPLDEPNANVTARDSVEKALMQWKRYDVLMDGMNPDLIIVVRTGNGKTSRPTVAGGPIDRRPGFGQGTDDTIRIGAQQGQAPPLSDPSAEPPNRGPHVSNEAGPSEDSFTVYRGDVTDPLDAPAAWRYVAKDCLRAPEVTAVEKFRKAVADSEQALQQQGKKKP
ncbi:MAG TPA: hypothetical protein VGS78_01655 [Candidatus Sulfotelmatobacter sp.]|nr:hypothetical protein [Candidatus Sulfotelmatobacter sp.]